MEERRISLHDVKVLAEGLSFPEGPVALGDGSVVFVEMGAGKLSRCDASGEVSTVAELGGGPNGAALGPDGFFYVCNSGEAGVGGSVQRVDPASGQFTVQYTECDGVPLRWPNDLVFDDTGGFWFTDFAADSILYGTADGQPLRRVITDVQAPNGVGLSPDGRYVLWSQTFTRNVMRRQVTSPGHVAESPGYSISALMLRGGLDPDTFVIGLPGAQEIDSLAVEADGSVCVGTLVDSGITSVPPAPTYYEHYVLPSELTDAAVTNICFGGPDLRTAYITLSMTGRIISCTWPRPGLKLPFQQPWQLS